MSSTNGGGGGLIKVQEKLKMANVESPTVISPTFGKNKDNTAISEVASVDQQKHLPPIYNVNR